MSESHSPTGSASDEATGNTTNPTSQIIADMVVALDSILAEYHEGKRDRRRTLILLGAELTRLRWHVHERQNVVLTELVLRWLDLVLRSLDIPDSDVWLHDFFLSRDSETDAALRAGLVGTSSSPASGQSRADAPRAGRKKRRPEPQPCLTLRLADEVVTADALGAVLASLTHLYTKLWLAAVGRFDDVIAYGATHDHSYAHDANLVITQITMNSPVTFVVTVSRSLGEAIASIIDAVSQAPLRWQQMASETQMKRFQAEILANERENQAQRAALDAEAKQLELERARLDLVLQQTRVQEAILEAETRMVATATGALRRQVDRLYPEADPTVRAMLVQSMLPDALQLGNYHLQVLLPNQPSNEP